jgi:hypothetical protein
MARAWVLIREQPWYRRQSFIDGLRACGYEVLLKQPDRPDAGDLLICWNRYSAMDQIATKFENEGGMTLCCENGYINADSSPPKFSVHPGGPKPHDYYAVGVGYHNDSARVLGRGPERFVKLGLELKPWRKDGDFVLIAPNRAFGAPGRAMSQDWADRAAARLEKLTKRRIVIRRHPGNDAPKRPFVADLENCWAVVIWSSSVAVHALANGVPCFIESPHQIVKPASASGLIDELVIPDRLAAFETMANGQWRLDEIERGEPFKLLNEVKS